MRDRPSRSFALPLVLSLAGPWRRLFGQAVKADVRILDPDGGG